MHPRRSYPATALLWTVLALLLSASSCDNSLEGEGEPPLPTQLRVVDSYPATPTLEDPDYVPFDPDWPVSLRLGLNQIAQPSDLVFSFFPAPLPGWTTRASQASPLYWIDNFQPDSNTVLQTIVVDGPRFDHPWLWEFWVVKEPGVGYTYIDANVIQRHQMGPSPQYAVFLFYPQEVASGVQSPAELFECPAVRAALPVLDLSGPSEAHFQRLVDGLHEDTYYTMAVILDTDGDGVYDPHLDWWGTAHVNPSGKWLPCYAQPQPAPDSPSLEAELLPPPVE